jgi:capsular polysaccharide biosynthesis protein
LPATPSKSPELAGIQHGPIMSTLSGGIACHLAANLDRDGAFAEGLTPGLVDGTKRRFLQRQRFFPRVRRVSGTAVSLVGEAHTNYYHWLLETLPRLRFVREWGGAYEWLYVCHKHQFHREGLSLFGCDGAQIIDSSRIPFLQADTLLVPRFLQQREPWVIPWLRELTREAILASVTKELPRRLYISRRKATSRKVVNEPELLGLLNAAGFVAVDLEDCSWMEQVALFQRAEAIAGPHGAGLANVIFCSPGTLIMELMPEPYPFHLYEELSLNGKLDYRRVEVDLLTPGEPGASDMKANLKCAEKILADAFGGGGSRAIRSRF